MTIRTLACGWGVVLLTGTLTAQPRIDIGGGETFSLGRLFRGETAERQIVLRNTGTDTLVVSRVDASCGCTGTVLTSPRIGPKKDGTLKISFNSTNFSGEVHKSLTIVSNASNAPQLVVHFTAEVIDEIVLIPPQFWVKDAEVGRTVTLSLRVRNSGSTPLQLKKARATLDGIVCNLPPSPIPPGSEVELRCAFTPRTAVPFLAEGIFIETSNERRREIYIPLYGNTKEFKFD